jgi:hypothetical protein
VLISRLGRLVLGVAILPSLLLMGGPAQAQTDSRTFPETGHTVSGAFLAYWQQHGGLAQQGFPISDEMQERSDTDGKTYRVQYFERAVFELHPELAAPNNVLLSLLGVFLYQQNYPNGAPGQVANTSAGAVLFNETGKHLGGRFLAYWQQHGGLAQQGYPISEEFDERSDLDGNTYRVQYFERAVFEMHTENQPPYDVLLSQLGTFRYRQKYGSQPPATPSPTVSPTSGNCDSPTSPIAPGDWIGSLQWGFTMSGPLTGQGGAGGPVQLAVACDGSFTGVVQINEYSAKITGNNIAVLTCSMSKPPIADVVGRVESGSDGKRLNITGGKFRQGVTQCSNPVAPAQPTDLTGKPVTPSTIKIEAETPTRISGSQWVPDASYVTLIQQLQSVYKDLHVTYTGHWQLDLQPLNTP